MALLSQIQTSYSIHTNSRHCNVKFSFVIKFCPNSVFWCNFRYEVRHQINLQSMSFFLFSFSNLTRRILIWLHCYQCKCWGMYHIKGRQFLLPVDREPRPSLIPTMLQIFPFIVNVDGFGGLVVCVLASGSRVRGFEPGRSRWISPSEGKLNNLSHVPTLRHVKDPFSRGLITGCKRNS
jgi:hypothetical protein